MADREAAKIFGLMFSTLADVLSNSDKVHHDKIIDIADLMWNESTVYDFDACQMNVDEALVKLGMVRVVKGIGSDELGNPVDVINYQYDSRNEDY